MGPAVTRSALLLIALAVPPDADDPLVLAELAGSYTSTAFGQCTLTLDSAGTAALRCRNHESQTGSAHPVHFKRQPGVLTQPAPAIMLIFPGDHAISSGTYLPPLSGTPPPAWPPSVDDPTAPLIRSQPPHTLLLLRPLHWGSRLYLLRHQHLRDFCSAVRQGVEPRHAAEGPEFLRVGDHDKPVGDMPPELCSN